VERVGCVVSDARAVGVAGAVESPVWSLHPARSAPAPSATTDLRLS